MISTDNDALICDFAETYHILDFRQLPPMLSATLAVGLSENSRIKLKMSKQDVRMDSLLLAFIADRLSFLCWAKTKDGAKGTNKPKYILDAIRKADSPSRVVSFNSVESFEKARKKILGLEG